MKALSTLIILLVSTVLFSQTNEIIHLWPGDVPGETASKKPAEETGNKNRGVTRLTNVTDPLLTVFRPEKPNGAGIVVCPGGGYNILAINLEGYEIAEWLSSIG